MITYIIRRLLQAILVLAALTVVFFMITHLTPGGPCAGQVQTRVDVARQAECVKRLGLDKPLPVQYGLWLSAYLHGDFGYALGGESVQTLILADLPVTILLATVSYALQLMIALPLGIFSALRQYSFFDTFFTFLSYVGLSMPTFWLGLMLIFAFGVHWSIFPVQGVTSATLPVFWTDAWFQALAQNPPLVLGDLARHLVLPALTLMVVGIATDSRFMRASMLDVIHQDYIRTAKAKGVRRHAVIFKHAFRNAILPIITNIALYLPTLVGGFVITETLFTYPGVGYLFFTSIQVGDYSVVDALLMLSAVAVLLANLLADLTYAWVDPRIRYD
jgi:peptide/nickel transport system permease protein